MITDRYRRQTLVKQLGQKGQEQLATKHAVIIGGGGLGSHSANLLVRMGIGSIDIIDDDIVDITNLHRTSLFTQEDLGKLKAFVLQEKLRTINTEVRIRGINQKVTKENIESLVKNADVIIDGTDSISLRFLINEVAMKQNIPWVYAGVYETIGMVMGILPKKTPCLQCISQNIPESISGEIPVLGSLPAIIASIQCTETIKLLLGKPLAGLLIYDIWNQCFDIMDIKRNPYCTMCGKKKKIN
jgi:molybdopterin-synthase adenylyltransferase